MAEKRRKRRTAAQKRIDEAIGVLKDLGVPREQLNERSALALLALLDLRPETPWSEAAAPMYGITEMMEYFEEHYRKKYAPNTRETVRRYSIHQFVQLGLVVRNPDDPKRPVNSPDNRYRIEPKALELLRHVGSDDWASRLEAYKASSERIRKLHAREREMAKVPVRLPDGTEIKLTAGGQNKVVKPILEEFCPRFTPGAKVVYVGDTGAKHLFFDEPYLRRLGVNIDEHGKMPDIVVHLPDKDWLVLIEAVTSHGPVSIKRHNELKDLFAGTKSGLVFVTAFPDRKTMVKYLGEIAWETDVWVADAPSHMIHLNGGRFFGPYP